MLPRQTEILLSYSVWSSEFGWPVIYIVTQRNWNIKNTFCDVVSYDWQKSTHVPEESAVFTHRLENPEVFISAMSSNTRQCLPWHHVKRRIQIDRFFKILLYFIFPKLLPSSGRSLKREDYKICGKLIWEGILKFLKNIIWLTKVYISH
jgi:hypothetical protein